MLSSTLKEIGEDAFEYCWSLKIIWVEDGCAPDIRKCAGQDVAIFPTRTMASDKLLRDLRRQKDVVIPEGVREIGERWFWNTGIESVTIPASVAEIGRTAFCSCKSLRCVTFVKGSQLGRIGEWCFCDSGIEEIKLPGTLR